MICMTHDVPQEKTLSTLHSSAPSPIRKTGQLISRDKNCGKDCTRKLLSASPPGPQAHRPQAPGPRPQAPRPLEAHMLGTW